MQRSSSRRAPASFSGDPTVLCRLVFLGMVLMIAGSSLTVPCATSSAIEPAGTPLRAGIIGLDTSHVTAFTQLLNAPQPRAELAGIRVVAGYPGGSADIPSSRDRVAGYTKELHDKYGVEIVDSIDELLKKVDVVLLESLDGRPHQGIVPSGGYAGYEPLVGAICKFFRTGEPPG